MKRILSLGMVLLALVAISACSSDEILNDENGVAQTTLTPEQAELAALRVGGNLMNSFKESVSRSGSSQQMIYPDYYGGCYLDENRNLVVLVTGDLDVYKQDVMTRANSSDFVLKPCEYSYNELNDAMDKLNQFFLNDENRSAVNGMQWHSFALSDKDNCIYVRLGDVTDANITRFKQLVSDSPMLEFEKSGGIPVLDAVLQPGSGLGYTSGNEIASMGYRAKYNGEEGFVTAGHFVGIGASVYQGSDLVGICMKRQITGSIDAAWCSRVDYALGNTTVGGRTLSSISPIIMMSSVYKEGIATGYTFGTMINANASSVFEIPNSTSLMVLTNIVEATYLSEGGDSGGIVYSDIGILGTHIGHNNGNTSYFAKAEEINRIFNLTIY